MKILFRGIVFILLSLNFLVGTAQHEIIVKNKHIDFGVGPSAVYDVIRSQVPSYRGKDTSLRSEQIFLTNCEIKSIYNEIDFNSISPQFIEIDSSEFIGPASFLKILTPQSGLIPLKLSNCELDALNISESKVNLHSTGNWVSGEIIIANSETAFYIIDSVKYISGRASGYIGINNCLTRGGIIGRYTNGMSYSDFAYDTITNSLKIINYFKEDSLENDERFNRVRFINSYIDGSIEISRSRIKTRVLFENCTFGPNASLASLTVDTIEFNNCIKFDKQVDLSTAGDVPCNLIFTNTDPGKFNFTYSHWYKLYFPTTSERVTDNDATIYETLIAKFKTENKPVSVDRLNVEYKQYNYRTRYYGGYLLDFIDRNWWYYGQRPDRPIYWSLWILLLFYLINLLNWKAVRRAYGIVPETRPNYYKALNHPFRMKLRNAIQIFIFTLMIFFSIDMKFEKVSFQKTRWTAWIIFQHLIGLFCIFFIVNAILKF